MAAKQFASNIQNDKTILRSNKVIKFGSATINDVSFVTTPDEVQSLPAWEEGMVPSQFPVTKIGPDGQQQTVYVASADNTNSALFALSGEIVEQEQEGIKFYDPLIIYKKGAKAVDKTSYFIYTSLQDDNQNFPLSNESYWERYNQPASETLSGMVIKANQFDMQVGIDNEKYITPALFKANISILPKITNFDVPNTYSFQCSPETKYAKIILKGGGGATRSYSRASGFAAATDGEDTKIQLSSIINLYNATGGRATYVPIGPNPNYYPGNGGYPYVSTPLLSGTYIIDLIPGNGGNYDGKGGGNYQITISPGGSSGNRGGGATGGNNRTANFIMYGAGEGGKLILLITSPEILRQTWQITVGTGGKFTFLANAEVIGANGGNGYAVIEEY